MVNSKLIQTLKTFSSQELLAFRDFVRSPFFNKNQELVAFYDYLKKCAPAFVEKQLLREKVYQRVFPKKAYDEKHLNYLMSFLLKLVEKYLGLTNFYENSVRADVSTLESLVERRLEKQYNYLQRKIDRQLENPNQLSTEGLLTQHCYHEIRHRHFTLQDVRKFDPSIQQMSDSLDLFYLTSKLKLNCEMESRQQILKANYQIIDPEQLTQYALRQYSEQTQLIQIYRAIYQLQTQQQIDQNNYQELKSLIQDLEAEIDPQELTPIYYHLINFCSRQIRLGDITFAQEALDVYTRGIRNEILLENGVLSAWTFKNTIKLYLGLRQYEKAAAFIEKKHTLLAEDFQKDAFHFNLADLHYRQQQFAQALEHLQQVAFTDIYYKLGSREMMLKIYYELQEQDLCAAQLEAFRIFLLRNKQVPKNIKIPYRNFIDMINALLKTPVTQRKSLRDKIRQTQQVIDRSWLLDKCS